jgi:uncharacterized protein (TIGR03435 family)
MNRRVFGLAVLAAGSMFGQNIVGDWQGTLSPPGAPRPLRLVAKVTRAADESLKATLYSIDQGGQPINAASVTLQGSAFKMTIPAIGGSYEGKLSSDGTKIDGTFTQGPAPLPLILEKATPQTAWAIPDPPPPPRLMPADAKPVFEVATIKPTGPDARGTSILVGRGGSNLFTTTNTTLKDLIQFAYGLHAKQVAGGPSWIETDRFDISAKPDLPGMPSVNQLKTMVQKMLEERFQITSHREKRELSAYVLTVAKGGHKMSKSQSQGPLPGFGGRGPGRIGVNNAAMREFAEFLQSRIVEKPVVDETGLEGRWDFTLEWAPDTAPAGPGAPDGAPAPAPNAEEKPHLAAAMQQQLGLHLESTKAPVEVMVLDKVSKPSEN